MSWIKDVKKNCVHYREIISECRNCDPDDAPYKICFAVKKPEQCPKRTATYD